MGEMAEDRDGTPSTLCTDCSLVPCSGSDWRTNNRDFRDRYLCTTKEFPRKDMCITLEQRPGGEDGDQATVWDCGGRE